MSFDVAMASETRIVGLGRETGKHEGTSTIVFLSAVVGAAQDTCGHGNENDAAHERCFWHVEVW